MPMTCQMPTGHPSAYHGPEWHLESGSGNLQTYKYIIIPGLSALKGKCHVENNNGGSRVVRKCSLNGKIKH